MKVGDVIDVLRIAMFSGCVKIPAIVVEMRFDSFTVKALREPFDEDGHDLLALNRNDRGRTWT